MNKKGFTLAEILGVIVIVGMLAVIITPTIINRLRGSSKIVDNANNNLIFASADSYINENMENFPAGKNYCIKIQTLIDSGNLSKNTKNIVTGEELNNYYVSANIYGKGNIDYNLYKTEEECKNVKAIPIITFTITGGWGNSKDVIINYPVVGNETYPDSGSDWKYSTDNKNWTNLNETTAYNGEGNKVNFTSNGILYAQMKYGDKIIKNKITIDQIDNNAPNNIEIANFPSNNNVNITTSCKDENNATITISDFGGSKLDKYAVTQSSARPTSGWIDIRDSNNERVNKTTVKYKVDYESSLEDKTYYVHVLDSAGTYNSQFFKAAIYHTVNLNHNYSGSTNTTQTVKNGETFSLPTPTRTGYTFKGWFKESEGINEVKTGDFICLGSDITLYAKWELAYTKPTCSLVLNGTKGNYVNNIQWYRGNVTVTMTTSTGLGAPTSYGLATTKNSTNGSNTTTQISDTKGTTYYGYVTNPAGSDSCSITVYKDATAPDYSSISGGGASWSSGNVTVTNKGSDATSGISSWQYLLAPQVIANPHVQTFSTLGEKVYNTIGTTDLAKRLEGFTLRLANTPISGNIEYNSYIEGIGWQGWKSNGDFSGTTGQAKKIYRIQVRLSGTIASYYNVKYRTHNQTDKWTAWKTSGQTDNSTGNKRVEAIQVVLERKDDYWTSANNSSGTYTYPFSTEQNATNYFRLCDNAGNCSSSKSVKIQIDKSKPFLVIEDVTVGGVSLKDASYPKKIYNVTVTSNNCLYAFTNNGSNSSCSLKYTPFLGQMYKAPEKCFDNLSGCAESEHKYIHNGIHNGSSSCYIGNWTKKSKMCWSASGGTYRELYSRVRDNAGNVSGEIKFRVDS